MIVKTYKELVVWQKSMDLVCEIYMLTKKLPKEETYGLCNQMQRAAVSIPSNIAEGQFRNSTKEFIQFLSFAKGSVAEIDTQLQICERLGYKSSAEIKHALDLCEEIGKMLNALIASLPN